jgi:hypothetical protein
VFNDRDLCLLATSELKGERPMPYKDVTYDNGFTERFYFDETTEEEAIRISRTNSASKFPSVNCRYASKKRTLNQSKPREPGVTK